MANSIARIDTILNDEIQAGVTKTVDSLLVSLFKHVDYTVMIFDASNTKLGHIKTSVTVNGNDVKESVYSKQGAFHAYELLPVSDGYSFTFNIKNNELFPIKLKILRTLI